MGVRCYAVLGYDGGKAKALADVPIHFAVDDMQISEDLQLVVGHMLMQWLCANRLQA
jgi:D-sedoheptulose 7-phosphate isomerase